MHTNGEERFLQFYFRTRHALSPLFFFFLQYAIQLCFSKKKKGECMKLSTVLTALSFTMLTESSDTEKISPSSDEFTTTLSITRSTPYQTDDSPNRPPVALSREDLVTTPNIPSSPIAPTRSFTPEEQAYRDVLNNHQQLLLDLEAERNRFIAQQDADFKAANFSWFEKKRNKPELLLQKQDEDFQAFIRAQRYRLQDNQNLERQFLNKTLEELAYKIKKDPSEAYKIQQLRKLEKYKNDKIEVMKKRHETEGDIFSPLKSRAQYACSRNEYRHCG